MKYKYLIFILLLIITFAIMYCQKCDDKLKVIKVPNFLDGDVCDKIINSNKTFIESNVLTNGISTKDLVARSSSTTSFQNGENMYIDMIKDRVIKMLDIRLDQLEPVQLSKYDRGQEYKYHYDYFNTEETNISNQRHYTILIYLNDVPICDGGSTDFKFGDSFQPVQGTMVYWSNLDKNMNIDTRTLHCGKPVLNDSVKYILTIWTRINSL
jgi:prolyl 4-hydroxylase